jgi:hypothetical protein
MVKNVIVVIKIFICEWTSRPTLKIEAAGIRKLERVFGN